MGLKVHNTLTGEKEEFKPLHPSHVRMYVCGPTVYDDPHIGHIRGAFVFDVIRKYLQYKKFEVKFVRNLTDVDDKIIGKARQQEVHSPQSTVHSLKEAAQKVASQYTKAYHEALEKLGIAPPDQEPKATEYIPKMQEMIQQLLDRGFAYIAEGNVYFLVGRFPSYGKLSHQNPGQLLKSHRVEEGHDKKNALDFALWKSAKPEEPQWASPWGPGRPGWHIECSVMSQREFGETLDIHGGGVDLVFPHHENEIAQSEACWEKPFANYWLHNGLLTVEGQKMSKSVGNVIGVEDILTRGYQAEDLKFFFLQSHYRSPVDFSWEKLERARKNRNDLELVFDECRNRGIPWEEVQISDPTVCQTREAFLKVMDDDFNTPNALAFLFVLYTDVNRYLNEYRVTKDKKKKDVLAQVVKTIRELGGTLGLFRGGYRASGSHPVYLAEKERRHKIKEALNSTSEQLKHNLKALGEEIKSENVSDLTEQYLGVVEKQLRLLSERYGIQVEDDSWALLDKLLEFRGKSRQAKKFKEADDIRNEIEKLGILVEDGNEGTTWRRRLKG
jgi:cysteinyl-tRNA synthetase